MEIRNLMTLIHVAELNSFTKAAQVLGYSQSTVSFQIRQLEEELGCLIFERINHTITLTEKGKELLSYAQKISHLTEEFKQDFMNQSEVKGSIHIVTSDSLCEMMMNHHYAEFYKRYPNIVLKVSNGDTGDMFRLLDQNEADVILTLDEHVYVKEYVIAKEERISTHFVTSSNSKLAQKKQVTLNELAEQPFILTEKNMGYRRALDEKLAQCSLEILPVLEIGRTDLITSLLETGDAVSFLPDFVTEAKVKQGKLVYLEVEDFDIDIWKQLIYHRNKWMSECFKAFLNFVIEHEFH